MPTLSQQITAAPGDVVQITITIEPPTVGTLSFAFDGLDVDLSENYDIIHTIISENPVLYLISTNDTDGKFVSASIEGQVFSQLVVDN